MADFHPYIPTGDFEMPALDDLTSLVAAENPYTNGDTNDMDIYLLAQSGNSGLNTAQKVASQIDAEMANYSGTWDFKGVPLPLSRALRIKYRYRVPDGAGGNTDRWRTDYLLIGFVNGGAG
jgi:hypothetical protein